MWWESLLFPRVFAGGGHITAHPGHGAAFCVLLSKVGADLMVSLGLPSLMALTVDQRTRVTILPVAQ